MALRQRQAFLLKLLTDRQLRQTFFHSDTNTYALSKDDFALLRKLDRAGLENKAAILTKKTKKDANFAEGTE